MTSQDGGQAPDTSSDDDEAASGITPLNTPAGSDDDDSASTHASNGASASGTHDERRLIMLGFGVALIGAIIGGGFSYLGAWHQSRTQLEAQEAQGREDRKKEDREKRAEVYEDFLGAADVFAVKTNGIITDCKDGKCSPNWHAWQTSRAEYQGALNQVWVYGSDQAVTQTGRVSAALPKSLWEPSADELHLTFESANFRAAYQGFQSLMCRELPASPRTAC
ncbi:hypothetical protein ACUN22_01420 [Streptomyces anulatus]|uniref:hypothetical protein n=1 Tax=Streptomyces anulatus TaxID=1892 RepID=UPI00403DC185